MASSTQKSFQPSIEPRINWTHALSHGLLQLCNDQKDKGHWKGTCLDEIGRTSVRAEFLKEFSMDLPWKNFKNRLDHLKKQYDIYKRITNNATRLGFNDLGELEMPPDWWNELLRSCPEASKLRAHPLKDIPLLDRLYSRVTISVSEGWQPRAGPKQMSHDPSSSFPQFVESDEETEPSISAKKSIPRKKSKVGSSSKQDNSDKLERLTTAIEEQGKIWKGGRENYEALNPYCTAACMEDMFKLTTLEYDSELYWAAIDYLSSDEQGRQVFMKLPHEEGKIRFLERKTGKVNWTTLN